MQRNQSIHICLTATALLCLITSVACTKSGSSAPAASADNKIPITTKSDDAKKAFLQGRDLSERLLGQESLAHFEKAVSLDPDFASGELALANNAPTTKEFFEHLNKAVALSSKVSDGEKLQIMAAQAGANGDVTKQKDYLDQLIAAYPNDERAQAAIGNYYFAQQDLTSTVEHYKKASEIAPNFSPSYNILGYAYKQQGNYPDAEQSFKKYIELIPNDPNPYDSYGELLLKMGRFDDSIAQYSKALSINSHFPSSHFGIATDLMYMGKSSQAASEMQKIVDEARDDGERRLGYFGLAVVASDNGKFNDALRAMDKEYAVAEKNHDDVSMAADLQAKGNIYAAMPNYAAASQQFEHSLKIIQASTADQQIKDNAQLLDHFNMAGIAIDKKDFAAAKSHLDAFRAGAEASKNPFQMKQAHELTGRLALAQKDYDGAISEIGQANLQDPRNLYRLGQAYEAKGDQAKANTYFVQAAGFNGLPALNYAFIRAKAQKTVAAKKV